MPPPFFLLFLFLCLLLLDSLVHNYISDSVEVTWNIFIDLFNMIAFRYGRKLILFIFGFIFHLSVICQSRVMEGMGKQLLYLSILTH